MVEDSTPPRAAKRSAPVLIVAAISAAFGAALGSYAGFTLLVPLVLAAMMGWALVRTVPAANKPMIPASAVQAGHGLWMLLGLLLLSQFDLSLLDVVILVGGGLWLAFRPSKIAVALLVGYQLIGLAVNGPAFYAQPLNTNIHKALLIHLLFRLAAILMMGFGLITIGRQQTLAAAEQI